MFAASLVFPSNATNTSMPTRRYRPTPTRRGNSGISSHDVFGRLATLAPDFDPHWARNPRQSVRFAAHIEASVDNCAMDKDRDLLPWIFGGLSMATVAIAIIVGSNNRPVPRKSPAPRLATAYALPPAPAETVPVAVPALVPVQALAAAQLQTVTPPLERSSQIWECVIDGQRTFSDKRCGEKPSVRKIGPINTMDPTPIFRSNSSYERQSSYAADYPDPSEQQLADNSYPVYVGVPYHDRRRPDRAHPSHDRGRTPHFR
jgi:hypothetical protein